MNRLFGALLAFVAVVAFPLFSLASTAPFHPHEEERFQAIESSVLPANYAADGLLNKRIARATWDASTDGAIGAHGLGVSLPAKAIILRAWAQVVTVIRGASASASTYAIHCEDANNILTAEEPYNDTAGLREVTAGTTGDVAQTVGNISAQCEITVTVAGAAQTSGKVITFVEYIVGE
jgi:hypothetical protein